MSSFTQKTVLLVVAICLSSTLLSCSASSDSNVSGSAGEVGQSLSENDADTVAIREVPQACSALDLSLGAAIEGAALGDCVSQALSSYGSGVMHMTGESTGKIEFTYDPEYSFQGAIESPTGDTRLVYTGGEMWVDSGEGFIKGDVNSAVFEEQMAGVAAELYRFYSDLEQTAQLISSHPDWGISETKETVEQPGGEQQDAYRIVNSAPFTWNEITIQEFVVWFAPDWVPVATQASTAVAGFAATNGQQFTDLGEPVVIELPEIE